MKSLNLFLVKAIVKFRNLQSSIFLKPIRTECFRFLSRLRTYLWGIHTLKNNFAVSRSTSYLYRVYKKCSSKNAFIFSKLKILLWNIEKVIITIAIKIYVKIPSLLPNIFSKYSAYKIIAHLYERWYFITAFPITFHAKKL